MVPLLLQQWNLISYANFWSTPELQKLPFPPTVMFWLHCPQDVKYGIYSPKEAAERESPDAESTGWTMSECVWGLSGDWIRQQKLNKFMWEQGHRTVQQSN